MSEDPNNPFGREKDTTYSPTKKKKKEIFEEKDDSWSADDEDDDEDRGSTRSV